MSAYPGILQSVLYPAHNLIRRRNYVRYSRLLADSQWWTYEKIRDFQWKGTLRLLKHAFGSVPYYKAKYAKAGVHLEDIQTWSDFAQLPTLTRDEVNACRQELCSTAFRGKLLPHATGGSSGTPTRFFRTYDSYDWRTAAKDRVYSWAGLSPGDRAVYLWGAPVGHVSIKEKLKTRTFDIVHRKVVFNTFSQDERLWNHVLSGVIQHRPVVIVGYVASLREFGRFLRERKIALPTLRGVIAAAEPMFGTVREEIRDGFGVPVYNTYGSREFMSIAGECEQRDGLHINAENTLIETPTTCGDSAEVLVTDLHNYGMPFVRYALGDIAELDESPCACGRGLPRLKTIYGRILDALKATDGRVVPGEFFPHVIKDVPEIKRYQVVQIAIGRIEIRAVVDGCISDQSNALLGREIRKVFGAAMEWEVRRVQDIPLLPSGKHRVTVGLG
jgi:phenylacetate-CoA ligase